MRIEEIEALAQKVGSVSAACADLLEVDTPTLGYIVALERYLQALEDEIADLKLLISAAKGANNF